MITSVLMGIYVFFWHMKIELSNSRTIVTNKKDEGWLLTIRLVGDHKVDWLLSLTRVIRPTLVHRLCTQTSRRRRRRDLCQSKHISISLMLPF